MHELIKSNEIMSYVNIIFNQIKITSDFIQQNNIKLTLKRRAQSSYYFTNIIASSMGHLDVYYRFRLSLSSCRHTSQINFFGLNILSLEIWVLILTIFAFCDKENENLFENYSMCPRVLSIHYALGFSNELNGMCCNQCFLFDVFSMNFLV